MKRLTTLLIFLFFAGNFAAQAQPKTPEQLERALNKASTDDKFAAANDLYYEKKYYHALLVFKNLVAEDPGNGHFNYKLGVCYLNSNTERTKALPYLLEAEKAISKNFNPYTYEHRSAPTETYFFLAQAYHLNYEFDKAIEYFEKLQGKVSKKHILYEDAGNRIAQCKLAKKMVEEKRTDVVINNLGPNINSEYSDFSPVLSLDGNVLYFTSRRVREDSSNIDYFNWNDGKHYEDIYVSYKSRDGEWGKPQVLSFSETDRNEATIGVSADGMELFAYIDDEGDGNIYYSVFQDTNFNDLEKIEGETTDINTEYWETHATISPDGNTMYFVSDRKGSMGGRDIYFVRRLPNGEWGLAQNIGAPINTGYDEDSPFIAADGKSLYYSSNGPQSMGGFDIFLTQMDENGVWSKPVNVGYPVNTVDDDIFFILSADGVTGYYSSLHEEKSGETGEVKDAGYGEKDIYSITFTSAMIDSVAILKGYIIPKPGEPIPSSIEIYATDLTTGEQRGPFKPRPDDGGYVLTLKPCHDYKVEYFMDGNLFSETEFTVPCEADVQTIHREIYLDPTHMAPEPTFDGAIVRWKVIDSPMDLSGNQVNYYDENGEISGQVAVDDNGIFTYPNNNHDYTFRFELDGQNDIICKSTCIALIDSLENILGYAIKTDDCQYYYEDIDYKWMLVDSKGNTVKKDNVKVTFKDENGNITNDEKLGCNGMFAYHPLSPESNIFFELDGLDNTLCDEVTIILLDKDNNKVGETTRDANCNFKYGSQDVVIVDTASTSGDCKANPASYAKFYKYNMKDIKLDEKRFKDFMDGVAELIKCNGIAKVEIESSASKVPTSTFKTNERLAQFRANDAKKRVLQAAKKAGLDTSKIKFTAINAQVLGPAYNDDYIKNRSTYEKYQYVKLMAK